MSTLQKKMTLPKQLHDELIGELTMPEEIYGRGGLIVELARASTELTIEGEII